LHAAVAAAALENTLMEALLTLNLFALSLPAALLGTALFGGLLSLPLWRRPGTTGPDSRPCG
jgi:ABC-type branched-subunit amino acid transport system permease subunit